nr:hypothetical protein [Planococcus sp. SK3692]
MVVVKLSKLLYEIFKNILGSLFFKYCILIIVLIVLAKELYDYKEFETNWERLVIQVIGLLLIILCFKRFGQVTISMIRSYQTTRIKELFYGITIIFVAVIFIVPSFFMLRSMLILGLTEWELFWSSLVFVLNTIVFAIVFKVYLQNEFYKSEEEKEINRTTNLFVVFFCYMVPALFITLENTETSGPIPDYVIISLNLFVASMLYISLIGYKNAPNNLKFNITFANFVQTFCALLATLASLELTMKNPLLFQGSLMIFILIYVVFISWKEIPKK